MAVEKEKPTVRQEEPTRFGAWRDTRRGSAAPVLEDDTDPGEPNSEERDAELGTVGLRLSKKDRERFTREARAEGVSLSEYLRNVLHDLEEDPGLVVREFLRELSQAQKNLDDFSKLPANKNKKTSNLAAKAASAVADFCKQLTEKPGEKEESGFFENFF